MFRNFYNLCSITKTPVISSRKFSVTLRLQQSYDSTIPATTVCEDDDEASTVESEESASSAVEDKRIPIINCKRKEFNFYKGTTYKKFDGMPMASQGWHHYKSKGDYFTIYPDVEERDRQRQAVGRMTFEQLGLNSKVQQVVHRLGFYNPTDIQKMAISEVLSGQNTIIQAETGTGKTWSYLLPIIDQILRWKPLLNRAPNSPLALILVPSRELVLQIGTEAKKLCYDLDIEVKILIGGRTKKLIRNPPVTNVDILIGTVGITSKLTTTRIYKLDQVRHTVLDEAHALFDETLDDKLSIFLKRINFGFKQSVSVNNTPSSSQLTMVSATMPDNLPEYLHNCLNVNSIVPIRTENVHKILVPQKFWRLGADQKPMTLLKLVKPRALRKEGTLIFSNSTATADWISIFLNQMNVNAVALNGNHPVQIRRDNYWDFRNGKVHILSTTNSSGRGLDTVTVDCIINYDFPMDTADYIHRCGRTGRVGSKHPGKVINFISRPLEIQLTQKIERATRRGRALPLFDIHEQMIDKAMDDEIRELLGSVPKE